MITDPSTGEVSSFGYALDTSAAQLQAPSLMDDISDVVTKGIPLTGMSIINSFANTAVEVNNLFGGNAEKLDISDYTGDTDTINYYNQHKQGIEAAGLIAGSLLPGFGAIKGYGLAMKAASTAYNAYRAGETTSLMARMSGFLPAVAKSNVVKQAISDIPDIGNGFYGSLMAEKAKAFALSFGDQALMSLAMEAAIGSTMHASPLLDTQSLSDVANNAFYGAALGGAFGGLVDGFFTVAKINRASVQFEKMLKPAEDLQLLGKGSFAAGDRIVTGLQSLDNLPVDEMQNITAGRLRINNTIKTATNNIRSWFGELTSGDDSELANAVTDSVLKMRASGADKEQMYWQLARMNNLSRLSLEDIDGVKVTPGATPIDGLLFPVNDSGKFFLNKTSIGDANPEDWQRVFSKTPIDNGTASLAYQLKPGATGSGKIIAAGNRISLLGEDVTISTQEDAFNAGADIYFDKFGKPSINPDSQLFEQVPRVGEGRILTQAEERQFRMNGTLPEGSKKFYSTPEVIDTLTGAVVDGNSKFTPTVGDLGNLIVSKQGVKAGDSFFSQSADTAFDETMKPIDANARYLWADRNAIANKTAINSSDLPVMESLWKSWSENPNKDFDAWLSGLEKKNITIDGSAVKDFAYSPENFLSKLATTKQDIANRYIAANPSRPITDAAQLVNVPEEQMFKLTAGELQNASAEQLINPVDKATALRHYKAQYELGNVLDNSGNVLKGMQEVQYRIDTIRNAMEDTGRNWAATHGMALEDFKIAQPIENFLASTPAGAGFLKFAQGAYNSAQQACEIVGRNVSRLVNSRYQTITDTLAPLSRDLKDDSKAALELNAFVAVRQRTGEKFVFLPDDVAGSQFGDIVKDGSKVAVLKDSIEEIKDEQNNVTHNWNNNYLPNGFIQAKGIDPSQLPAQGLRNFYVLSPKVAAWEQANMELNDARILNENSRRAALGLQTRGNISTGVLYTPPIDTAKYPYFVYAKQKAGLPLSDDGTGIITASSYEDLQNKILALGPDFETYTKQQLADYKKAYGEYDFTKNFYNSRVNSEMTRKGILNDVIPNVNLETTLQRYTDWHAKMETSQIRNFTELVNGQLFAELDSLGDRFSSLATSKMQNPTQDAFAKMQSNPFDSYKRLALNVSNKDQYTFWNYAQEKVESYADTAFKTMRDALTSVRLNQSSVEEANNVMKTAGLGDPFGDAIKGMQNYEIANQLPPQRYLSKIIAANNAILGSAVIKFDPLQQLLHAITTPMLAAVEGAHVLTGGVAKDLFMTALPTDESKSVFAVAKPMYKAITNFFRQNSDEFADRTALYKGIVEGRTTGSEEISRLENVSLPMGINNDAKAEAYYGSLKDFLRKPFDLSEAFSNFVACDVGYQIFHDTLGYEGKDLSDNIWSFVNRIKTNIVTAQRPIAFQGPIGQAVGLFQSFYLNLMQNMFRYVGNGEAKTMALMGGLQGTLFGAQGLPGLNVINQAIASASGNTGNADIYSTLPDFFGQTLGKYILYGSVSNVLGASMYTRAEMNPRNLTVLPVNPLEWAGISGSIRFVQNIYNMFEKVAGGGDAVNNLLMGIEHNGVSRPLAGLAQLMQGYSTTSKGGLIATNDSNYHTSGLSDLFGGAYFARLIGARPLDEAIILNDDYRRNLFAAKDRAAMEFLGEEVRSNMLGGKQLSPNQTETFMNRYASLGGNMITFPQKMMQWQQESTVSMANKVLQQLNSPRAQQAMKVMGGQPLPDVRNTGTTMAPQSPVAPLAGNNSTVSSNYQKPLNPLQPELTP